jgi:hypothetical protein
MQGQGLFAAQAIECGEMIIEYAGEVIRRVCCACRAGPGLVLPC